MPLEGEKLDELLSGFIDGELNDVERKLVEEAARANVRVEERILLLRRQAGEVAELGRKLAELPQDIARRSSLADTVIAQARQRAAHIGLPAHHFVHGSPPASRPENPTSSGMSEGWPVEHPLERRGILSERFGTWGQRAWIGGALLTAAAVLLAIFVPWHSEEARTVRLADSNTNDAQPTTPVEAEPVDTSTADQVPATRVVGRFGDLTYVLVVDVQVTVEGLNNRVLEGVLAASGIPRAPALPATQEILKALDQSRMIVNPQTSSERKMYLTIIRADQDAIDRALQHVWEDQRHFPNVSLNLAIDARTALVREILNSTGGRFSLSDSFAIPLTAGESAPELATASPFAGATDGVHYVSSGQRARGWGGQDLLAVPAPNSKSTILLVTHLVE